jgi:hypothetical protein
MERLHHRWRLFFQALQSHIYVLFDSVEHLPQLLFHAPQRQVWCPIFDPWVRSLVSFVSLGLFLDSVSHFYVD